MRERSRNHNLVRAVLLASLAFTALMALLMVSNIASAHELGGGSVNGGEIRYEVLTDKYRSEVGFAVSKWNDVGVVPIRQGGSGANLEFRDYSNCRKNGTTAYYQAKRGPDLIAFNDCSLRSVSSFDRRGTATHEVGHALGLGHTPATKYWRKNSVMYPYFGRPINTPQEHDTKDLRKLHGGKASTAERMRPNAESSGVVPSDIEPEYAFDVTDPKKLVGSATNVFVGRVIEKTGSEGTPLSGPGEKVVPQTQFSVEVLNNVKGNLKGTVTVDRIGGYDEEEGREVNVAGDRQLEPGREYMFSTNRDRKKGWYAVVAQPFGNVPVEDEAQRAEIEERFERAKAEEIPLDIATPGSF